jgi:hypothetical protein
MWMRDVLRDDAGFPSRRGLPPREHFGGRAGAEQQGTFNAVPEQVQLRLEGVRERSGVFAHLKDDVGREPEFSR